MVTSIQSKKYVETQKQDESCQNTQGSKEISNDDK